MQKFSLKDRLKLIIEENPIKPGISEYEFAKSLGTYQAKFAEIRSGKVKKLSTDIAIEISKQYGYELLWILNGEGSMFRKNNNLQKITQPRVLQGVPSFRSRLQEIQTKNRLLDREMAKLLKISERDYMSLCVGKKRPNIDVIDRIKENFNVDTDWLLYGEETTPQAPQPAQPEQINSQTLPPLTPKQYKKLLKLLED